MCMCYLDEAIFIPNGLCSYATNVTWVKRDVFIEKINNVLFAFDQLINDEHLWDNYELIRINFSSLGKIFQIFEVIWKFKLDGTSVRAYDPISDAQHGSCLNV